MGLGAVDARDGDWQGGLIVRRQGGCRDAGCSFARPSLSGRVSMEIGGHQNDVSAKRDWIDGLVVASSKGGPEREGQWIAFGRD